MAVKPSYEELERRIEELERELSCHGRMEEALQESERQYWSLFRNSHSCMLLIDPANEDIVDANPAAELFYGWSREELTGKKITDINTLTKDEVRREMEKAGREQKKHFLFRHRLSSEDIRDVEVYSGPVVLDGRKLLYSIIHDITGRRLAERRQREINELLEDKVKEQTASLEEINTALKIILQKREEDKQELEEKIHGNYQSLIVPFLLKLKSCHVKDNRQNLMAIIESNLGELLEPFSKKLSDPAFNLTPAEIQIAVMIKQGLSNKEMAQTLNKSVRTISSHREHIRRKLGLTNKKINLRAFLSAL